VTSPNPSPSAMDRVGGAPVSWGVNEVPDWGHQLNPHTVLSEMSALGLTATEAGPDSFLPADSQQAADMLAGHGLKLIAGFVPVALHQVWDTHRAETLATRATWLRDVGASVVVLAAATGLDGYETRPDLDFDGWKRLLANLQQASTICTDLGMLLTIHPHVGTMVQRPTEIEYVLRGTDLKLCLDTGHILAGGGDPKQIAENHPDRIGHVHFKDVKAPVAEAVRTDQLSYAAAVRQGLYACLGDGDVDIAGIMRLLENNGYTGRYVVEQDLQLTSAGAGHIPRQNMQRNLAYLRGVTATLASL